MEHIGGHLKEIPNGSFVLVSYDQYSMGWKFALELFKRELEDGKFGIFVNTTIPLRKVEQRGRVAGLDMETYGNRGDLVVVNLFPESVDRSYVYALGRVDEETLIPKFHAILEEIETLYDLSNSVGLFATADGLYELMGEQVFKKFIMASAVASERITRKYRYYTILVENYEILPRSLHAWLVSMSEYYFLTTGMISENSYSKILAVLKSPLEGFEPEVYVMKKESEPWS